MPNKARRLRLTDAQQLKIVELKERHGLSQATIAERFSCTVQAVNSVLHRSRRDNPNPESQQRVKRHASS
jgi:DNA-directed RNA polymerase specialized sigma24 family protein